MKTSDFFYELPEELIAQDPLEDRTASRLLVLDRKADKLEHKIFSDVIDYLNPGDCLVINNTRVIPARLIGEKEDTGGKVEILLLKRRENDIWESLVKPGKKLRPGARVTFGDGRLKAEILEIAEEGNRLVKFYYEGIDGSAAAPTAGLHFTNELLEKIRLKGVRIASITLHVGLGTFRPVKVEDVNNHHMHTEWYEVNKEAADIINETKKNGGRVICVGTTSCRTIESVADENGLMSAKTGETDIFIYPGYKFKVLDALITNFHLPESTLVMLVSALAGRENILHAYEEAVKEKYRFFSFGDAMFIN